MKKNNLFGEWLLVVSVPSVILILMETLVELVKKSNLFLAILTIASFGLLYFAELYSLVLRTLEALGFNE